MPVGVDVIVPAINSPCIRHSLIVESDAASGGKAFCRRKRIAEDEPVPPDQEPDQSPMRHILFRPSPALKTCRTEG